MRRLVPCLLVLAGLLLATAAPAHAVPPAEEPTPPPGQGQAEVYRETCVAHYGQGDFMEALEACQTALLLYQQSGDRAGEAATLSVIALIHDTLADYEQALIYYQQALLIWREIGSADGEATTLNGIALVYKGLSDYEQALAYYEQALTKWQEIGNQAWVALTLRAMAEIYHTLSDCEQALTHYEQALTVAREINDLEAEGRSLTGIGTVYGEICGNYEQALVHLQQALAIWQEIGHREGEAVALTNLGLVHYHFSDYEQALAYYEQALEIRKETADQAGEASALTNMASVYEALSDYDQALMYYEQALLIWQEIGHREGEAAALIGIGLVYYRLADYERALAYSLQGLNINQEIGDRNGEATALVDIGAIYHHLSEYEQAVTYYRQALSIQRAIGDRFGEATTLNNIGLVYSDLGRYEEALDYYQQALDIWQEMGDRARAAGALGSIGRVYHALSDYEQALAYYEQALPIQQEVGDRFGEAMTLHNVGVVHVALSDYEQALVCYRQALLIQQEIGDRIGEAKTLYNLSLAQEKMGQQDQALELSLQAVTILESIHGQLKAEVLQASFAVEIASYYQSAVRLLLAQGREADAFHYAERGRARTLLTLLGNQRVDPKGSEDSTLIQHEAELRGELAALEGQLEEESSKPADQRSQQLLDTVNANLRMRRQEYEQLLTQLQLTNPEYAALVSIAPLTIEEAQELLREQAPGVTLLAYFVGQEETVVFAVGPETFHAEAVTVTRQELRQQADALLAQMSAAPLLPDGWLQPAQTLHAWLIAPVQEHLPPPNSDAPPRLGIVPHDLLHYLPFGLLCDGEVGDQGWSPLLLEGYTLFYAPSISSLEFIFQKRRPNPDTLLALANPETPGAPHLHYAVDEVEAVAALYGTTPFIGPQATEGRFRTEAREYEVVHIAAHSDYNPRSPLFSAILLQPDDANDGRLETHEVFDLDLPHTDLVVLSACETHLGELSAGDELVGLERAFIRAGSPSLLTTLWPVDDVATAELMQRFYTHLRGGVPKAEALRLAQLETRAQHPDAYTWAGFVLVGDTGPPTEAPAPTPTPVEEQDGSGVCRGCGGAAALLAAVGALGWRRRRVPREKGVG